MRTRISNLSPENFLRLSRKTFEAPRRTEIKLFAGILSRARRLLRIDHHPANRVLHAHRRN